MKPDRERDLMLLLLGHALGQQDRSCAAELTGGCDRPVADRADAVADKKSMRVWELCRELWGVERGPTLIDAVRVRFQDVVTLRKVKSVSNQMDMAIAAGDMARVGDLAMRAYQFCERKGNGESG